MRMLFFPFTTVLAPVVVVSTSNDCVALLGRILIFMIFISLRRHVRRI